MMNFIGQSKKKNLFILLVVFYLDRVGGGEQIGLQAIRSLYLLDTNHSSFMS